MVLSRRGASGGVPPPPAREMKRGEQISDNSLGGCSTGTESTASTSGSRDSEIEAEHYYYDHHTHRHSRRARGGDDDASSVGTAETGHSDATAQYDNRSPQVRGQLTAEGGGAPSSPTRESRPPPPEDQPRPRSSPQRQQPRGGGGGGGGGRRRQESPPGAPRGGRGGLSAVSSFRGGGGSPSQERRRRGGQPRFRRRGSLDSLTGGGGGGGGDGDNVNDPGGFFVETFVQGRGGGRGGGGGGGGGRQPRRAPSPGRGRGRSSSAPDLPPSSPTSSGGGGGGGGGNDSPATESILRRRGSDDGGGGSGGGGGGGRRGRASDRASDGKYKRSKSAPAPRDRSARRVRWADEAADELKTVTWAEDLCQVTCISELTTCRVPAEDKSGSISLDAATASVIRSQVWDRDVSDAWEDDDDDIGGADLNGAADDGCGAPPEWHDSGNSMQTQHASVKPAKPNDLKRAFYDGEDERMGGSSTVADRGGDNNKRREEEEDDSSIFTEVSVDSETAAGLAETSLNLVGALSQRVESEMKGTVAQAAAANKDHRGGGAPGGPAPALASLPAPSSSRDVAAVLKATLARQQLLKSMVQPGAAAAPPPASPVVSPSPMVYASSPPPPQLSEEAAERRSSSSPEPPAVASAATNDAALSKAKAALVATRAKAPFEAPEDGTGAAAAPPPPAPAGDIPRAGAGDNSMWTVANQAAPAPMDGQRISESQRRLAAAKAKGAALEDAPGPMAPMRRPPQPRQRSEGSMDFQLFGGGGSGGKTSAAGGDNFANFADFTANFNDDSDGNMSTVGLMDSFKDGRSKGGAGAGSGAERAPAPRSSAAPKPRHHKQGSGGFPFFRSTSKRSFNPGGGGGGPGPRSQLMPQGADGGGVRKKGSLFASLKAEKLIHRNPDRREEDNVPMLVKAADDEEELLPNQLDPFIRDPGWTDRYSMPPDPARGRQRDRPPGVRHRRSSSMDNSFSDFGFSGGGSDRGSSDQGGADSGAPGGNPGGGGRMRRRASTTDADDDDNEDGSNLDLFGPEYRQQQMAAGQQQQQQARGGPRAGAESVTSPTRGAGRGGGGGGDVGGARARKSKGKGGWGEEFVVVQN